MGMAACTTASATLGDDSGKASGPGHVIPQVRDSTLRSRNDLTVLLFSPPPTGNSCAMGPRQRAGAPAPSPQSEVRMDVTVHVPGDGTNGQRPLWMVVECGLLDTPETRIGRHRGLGRCSSA